MRSRLVHKATAHHWRHNRRGNSIIGTCSCGYRSATFRRVHRRVFVRGLVCRVRGHRWDEPDDVHVGPVGFEEGPDTYVATCRQCDFCWKVEEVEYGRPLTPEWTS